MWPLVFLADLFAAAFALKRKLKPQPAAQKPRRTWFGWVWSLVFKPKPEPVEEVTEFLAPVPPPLPVRRKAVATKGPQKKPAPKGMIAVPPTWWETNGTAAFVVALAFLVPTTFFGSLWFFQPPAARPAPVSQSPTAAPVNSLAANPQPESQVTGKWPENVPFPTKRLPKEQEEKSELIWVHAHNRHGTWVDGYYRRRDADKTSEDVRLAEQAKVTTRPAQPTPNYASQIAESPAAPPPVRNEPKRTEEKPGSSWSLWSKPKEEPKTVHVGPYQRDDGTWVKGYDRKAPSKK